MLYFTVAAIVLILDQASKRLVWGIYGHGGGTDLIDGFLRIRVSTNTGAIFGILSGSRVLLLAITLVSVAALIYFAYRMRFAPISRRVYIGLIIGGAFGNLIDRLASGEVVDFIDMGIGGYRWPTYNIADIAVTLGAVLIMIGFIAAGDENGSDSGLPEDSGSGLA